MPGESARINGRRGGRPRGKIAPEVVIARRAIQKTLREKLMAKEEKYWSEIERIAFESPSDATRLSACNTYFDRVHGKAVQPQIVMGQSIMRIQTGVPRDGNDLGIVDMICGDAPKLIEHDKCGDKPAEEGAERRQAQGRIKAN